MVNFNQVFMTDFPEISRALPGYQFAANRSTWAEARGYPDNVELEVAATYASSGAREIDSVADTRAATVNIHYSLSLLPEDGYRPRLADDRIGYFVTALKDYSHKVDDDRFIRYINRWDLQKADPVGRAIAAEEADRVLDREARFRTNSASRSAKEFWSGTRRSRRPGSSMRSKFASSPTTPIGMPKTSITTRSAGSPPAPASRWGPRGQIRSPGRSSTRRSSSTPISCNRGATTYEVFTPKGIAALTGGPLNLKSYQQQQADIPRGLHAIVGDGCDLEDGESREMAFGSAILGRPRRTDLRSRARAAGDAGLENGGHA